ncbi:hypothetical protein Sjap_005294 [Stephania japonica]|uniref:Protein FAR1-RELATED SEQUENCE n=1 Tax=Stephania japonica TaxID=461633 RepID=A0AAP0PLQ2_9MAGN
MVVGCEQTRKYNSRKGKGKRMMEQLESKDSEDEENKKLIGTKKCGYEFKSFVKHELDDLWHVRVVCEVHNHRLTNSLAGHAYAGRLTAPEKVIVEDLSKTTIRSKDILSTICVIP